MLVLCTRFYSNTVLNLLTELLILMKCDFFVELYDVIDNGDLERAREILGTIENREDAINRYYRGPNTLLCK